VSQQMKYIVLRAGEQEFAVIFDKGLAHINVADGIRRESAHSQWSKVLLPLEPVAAGFVYMPEAEVDPHTGSESLKLKPRPQDQALIRGERPPVLERARSGKGRL
jgi:hypothetical protein